MAKVVLAHNLIKPEMLRQGPLDRTAELDSEATIDALVAALESVGNGVVPLDVDNEFCGKLLRARPDIVFNITEGFHGESREAQVPAICEMLGIPYTGSGVLSLATCQEKARTKEVLAYHGIGTPPFQVMRSPDEVLDERLRFPLIVKLLHQGSSMGLSDSSIVDEEDALRSQVERVWMTYGEPMLVEEFIQGREFTVGVLGNAVSDAAGNAAGNAPPTVLPIAEYVFKEPRGIMLFIPDDPVLEAMKRERGPNLPHFESACTFVCPADVGAALQAEIEATALTAYRVLGLRDWGRMEMRLGPDCRLNVLEVNPIAGIDPTYALPKQARAAGMSYAEFVNTILQHAMARYGLAG